MRVQELWRYPVKPLRVSGYREAIVTADGVERDRRYAMFDLATGLGPGPPGRGIALGAVMQERSCRRNWRARH